MTRKTLPVRTPDLYIMGDVHGFVDQLLGHLVRGGLVDKHLRWTGGKARLWLVGDLFDKGPDGLGVVNLVRLLQSEAALQGGEVGALIGNHDLCFLAAYRFARDEWAGASFEREWLGAGGEPSDMTGLTYEHVTWLESLPAMAIVDELLIVHADSAMYVNYGADVPSVNASIRNIITSQDPLRWQELLADFGNHHAFDSTSRGGTQRLQHFLDTFGGKTLIHGHTPIDKVTEQNPKDVHGPHIYAEGLCVNVDGGMYRGGPGFLYRVR